VPYIKLKQSAGEYSFSGQTYQAGKIYEVAERTGYYLVHTEKVADAIPDEVARKGTFFEINNSNQHAPSKKVKIAMVRLGGMGDAVILGIHAKAVKRKYPDSEIVLYIRTRNEIIDDMPHVDRSVLCGQAEWTQLLGSIRDKYDIIMDNRYVTKVIYQDEKKWMADKAETDKHFKPFEDIYLGWIRSASWLESRGIHSFDIFYESTGYEGGRKDLEIELQRKDYRFAQLLEGDKYVTVHNGADLGRQTKSWPTDRWNRLTEMLTKRGYKVIQLGVSMEEAIKGAKHLMGMTTMTETAGILAKANFHIDSESGLVHIARLVGTRSIVMFGPTPVKCFHYEENLPVVTQAKCKGCWWTTDFWWRECPRTKLPETPECMLAIEPEDIMQSVEAMEKLPRIKVRKERPVDLTDVNEAFAVELELTEGHYRSEKHQWERVNAMMDAVKGPRVLEVGAGDGYCVHVLAKRGYQVECTEISEIRLKRMRDAGIKAHRADIRKLPFPDKTFDTVMCGEVLEHIPNWWEGMKELERVMKPNGRLILSYPLSDRYDGIMMHLWAIRMIPIFYEKKIDMGVFVMEHINRETPNAKKLEAPEETVHAEA